MLLEPHDKRGSLCYLRLITSVPLELNYAPFGTLSPEPATLNNAPFGTLSPEPANVIRRSVSYLRLFGVRGSHVRDSKVGDFALFWDYRLHKKKLPPEFRIPVAAQIRLSPNKYIVDHTKAQRAIS